MIDCPNTVRFSQCSLYRAQTAAGWMLFASVSVWKEAANTNEPDITNKQKEENQGCS